MGWGSNSIDALSGIRVSLISKSILILTEILTLRGQGMGGGIIKTLASKHPKLLGEIREKTERQERKLKNDLDQQGYTTQNVDLIIEHTVHKNFLKVLGVQNG